MHGHRCVSLAPPSWPCAHASLPPPAPLRHRSFNVYVSQPEVKPGCVLRRANFNVLERRGLVDGQQVRRGGAAGCGRSGAGVAEWAGQC